MKFIRIIKRLNLFQPLKAKTLSEVDLKIGDTVACLNNDNSLYGICGLISADALRLQEKLPLPQKLLQ